MARDRYGQVTEVKRDNLTEGQQGALKALLAAGAIVKDARISAWALGNRGQKFHGRVFGSLYERGLIEGVKALDNSEWNMTNWWLTAAGREVTEQLAAPTKEGQG